MGRPEAARRPARRRGWLVRRALLASDLVGLAGAFAAAQALSWAAHRERDLVSPTIEILLFVLVFLPLWVVAAKVVGLYSRDEEDADHSTADEVFRVFTLVTVSAWLTYVGSWIAPIATPDTAKLVAFWALAIALVITARSGARFFCRRAATYRQNAVIVGAGPVGRTLAQKLGQHPEYGIRLLGFVDDRRATGTSAVDGHRLLGVPEDLSELVPRLDVERVIVADPAQGDLDVDLLRDLRSFDLIVDVVPRHAELVAPGVRIHTVEGFALMGFPRPYLSPSSRLLKRSFDLVLSSVGMVLLAPALAAIALAIKLDSRGPVFFRQERAGSHGEQFLMWKFRTMASDADSRKAEVAHLNKHAEPDGDPRMFKVPDDPRATTVGRWLRSHSLDELPQLLNIARGEMSFVGPRPLILAEDEHVDAWARHRLDLRPGLTGLWQVLGRSDISFEEMLRLDYLYVTSWSLGSDIRLILRTVPLVVRTRGAY